MRSDTDAGQRTGWLREDVDVGRLEPPGSWKSGVDIARRGGQRPCPVLASRGGCAGPGASGACSVSRCVDGLARIPTVRGVADRADQRSCQFSADEMVLVLDDYHVIETSSVHDSLSFLVGTRRRRCVSSWQRVPTRHCRSAASRIGRADGDPCRGAAVHGRRGGGAVPRDRRVAPERPGREGARGANRRLGSWSAAGGADASESHRPLPVRFRRFPGVSDSSSTTSAEVLERQSPSIRDFLLETSVLDRLCGSLCDAVIGRGDGQAMLEAIEKANVFLLPLDEVRGWWRYHHLFADLLRARLRLRPARSGAPAAGRGCGVARSAWVHR